MRTVGYDVGGAHLKVAVVEHGRVVAARQLKCALWQGLDHLDAALDVASSFASRADAFAVTMTGELTEIFDSRHAGVTTLVERLDARLSPRPQFYMGFGEFGTAMVACDNAMRVGSANYLATAELISQRSHDALLIDMGSTTTDIVMCDRPIGTTDADRLRTGELVYTGLTRTLVPTVTTRAPFRGEMQGLARDAFATMADVRRILGALPGNVDLHPTTDGRGTSVSESLVRFARGFGRDGQMDQIDDWQASAAYVREIQLQSMIDGAHQVLAVAVRPPTLAAVAGIGGAEAAEVARRLDITSKPWIDLIDVESNCRDAAIHCAPAAAVAWLLEKQASR